MATAASSVAAVRRADAMWAAIHRGMPAVGRHRTPVPGSRSRARSCGPLAAGQRPPGRLAALLGPASGPPRRWGVPKAQQPATRPTATAESARCARVGALRARAPRDTRGAWLAGSEVPPGVFP